MSSQTADSFLFNFLPQIPVVVRRHEGQITSDAGLLPIIEFDLRWNYTARMAQRLTDPAPDIRQEHRQENRKPLMQHQRVEMLRQRLFGILAGYEDCNDHDTLRSDPVFKLAAPRLPDDPSLASQPTLTRFENSVTIPCLYKLLDSHSYRHRAIEAEAQRDSACLDHARSGCHRRRDLRWFSSGRGI